MVRYTKNKGDKAPYRKRFPGIKGHEHLTEMLAKMKPEQYQVFREIAKHYTGEPSRYSETLPKQLKEKILPSAFQTIADTEFPIDLNRVITEQQQNHDDHSQEYHMGGGVANAVSSTASYIWNAFGYDALKKYAREEYPEIMMIWDLLPQFGKPKRKLKKMDKYNADTVIQAYKSAGQRAMKIHGWLHLPKYDGPHTVVYLEPKSMKVHIGVRGTKSPTFLKDLGDDFRVLFTQHPSEESTNIIRQNLVEISRAFPKSDITVTSHSLGGALITDTFLHASSSDKYYLDNIDHIIYLNPGGSGLAETEGISQMLKDDRVRLFLNKSDLINQAYAQETTADSDVIWGTNTANPYYAHQPEQWGSGNFEENVPIEWPDYPEPAEWVPPLEETWPVGEHTKELFAPEATPLLHSEAPITQ